LSVYFIFQLNGLVDAGLFFLTRPRLFGFGVGVGEEEEELDEGLNAADKVNFDEGMPGPWHESGGTGTGTSAVEMLPPSASEGIRER
jgi:hypothetical protein